MSGVLLVIIILGSNDVSGQQLLVQIAGDSAIVNATYGNNRLDRKGEKLGLSSSGAVNPTVNGTI